MLNEIKRIVKKIEDGKDKLLNNEVESYCSFTMFKAKGTDSLPDICEDFKFISIYTVYYEDLTFKSEYYKNNYFEKKDSLEFLKEINKSNTQNLNAKVFDHQKLVSIRNKAIELGFLRKVQIDEVEKDKEYLNRIADIWRKNVEKENHSDQMLKQTSEETRGIIREIRKKAKENNIIESILENEIKLVLWKSKYIHYKAVLIAEQIELSNQLPYKLKLNGVTIFYTFRSLVHILNRHYAKLISNSIYSNSKSYHTPIFLPNNIHLILEKIFRKLNQNDFFNKVLITYNESYNFEYLNVNYQLYLKQYGNKSEELMISSFYPIEDEQEIDKLEHSDIVYIDTELKWYHKFH